MGSSPSLPQAQCPVQPVHQAQTPIRCQRCDGSKVKWKCVQCVLLMCDKCGRDVKGHNIIDITTIQVKISDVKEYQTKLIYTEFLAVSYDNSLWIGDGFNNGGGSNPFKSHTALQNVKLVGDKVKVISSFKMRVKDVAVKPNNDILLATTEPRLKQIKAGSNKVSDSIYCTEWYCNKSVHVTKDGRVIVGGDSGVVVVMDTDGRHLTRYEKDENNKEIFPYDISSLTSTTNGNIFAASDGKVVVLGKTEIINTYRGHPTVNEFKIFYPSSLVTTPIDNVIVADSFNNTLHILDNTGHLLTTYNTAVIGISCPNHLAITTEGLSNVLYINGRYYQFESLYKMVITGC